MEIGGITLENNIFLAPMAGVTDMPFRILCREQGCGLVYSEMISAKGMYYKDEKSWKLADIAEGEKPAAVQIFGSEPDILAHSAEKLNASDAAILDINMGCPTPKITKNGEGSALMRTPGLAAEIIRAVCSVSNKPVTVKIRKGWDDDQIHTFPQCFICADHCFADEIVASLILSFLCQVGHMLHCSFFNFTDGFKPLK